MREPLKPLFSAQSTSSDAHPADTLVPPPRTESGFFVFEGPNDVGKSTLSRCLKKYLDERRIKSELLSFPGGEPGTLGEHVYRLYHDPNSFGIKSISIITEQILFTAAHAEVIQSRILPALSDGVSVILDRYWWSTWVYATHGNLDLRIRDLLIQLELEIWRGVKPTCIFLLNRNPVFERNEDAATHRSLTSLYNQLRAEQSSLLKVVDVDNSGQLDDSVTRIVSEVEIHAVNSTGSIPG